MKQEFAKKIKTKLVIGKSFKLRFTIGILGLLISSFGTYPNTTTGHPDEYPSDVLDALVSKAKFTAMQQEPVAPEMNLEAAIDERITTLESIIRNTQHQVDAKMVDELEYLKKEYKANLEQ